jgi:selenocysteine lyase/cysteine desulfurase
MNIDDEEVWSAVKAHFPAAAQVTYVNTAGGGCMSRAAAAAGRLYYDEAEREGDLPWERWLARAAEARRTVARLIGAGEGCVALLPNASVGLDLVHRLFDDGRDVVVLDREFPSVSLPWVNRGRRLRVLPLTAELGVDWDGIDPGLVAGTGVLAVSHVGFRTGYRLDLGEASRFARRHGLRLMVDATQSAGTVPISVADARIDALVFSGYKWCGAGYGIGALYLHPDHIWRPGLPAAGWRSAETPYTLRFDSFSPRETADALELGHPPFPSAFALDAALKLLMDLGIETIGARLVALTRHLHEGLDRLGLRVISTRDVDRLSGITIAAVPNAASIVAALRERGIVVSTRDADELRISAHVYTLKADIDGLLDALRALTRG